MIAEGEPCIACGGPVFDLASPGEREALRFTLVRRTQLRAGLGGLIGWGIGFVYSLWLSGDTGQRHYGVTLAWAIAVGSLAALIRPRAIAELEVELAERAGRATSTNRSKLSLVAAAFAIVVATAITLDARWSTMPRGDAQRLVVHRTCELAQQCNTSVMCIADEITAELQPRRARVSRDQVDECLRDLDVLAGRHAQCDAPAPVACTAITKTTIPKLVEDARALDHQIDGMILDQLESRARRPTSRVHR